MPPPTLPAPAAAPERPVADPGPAFDLRRHGCTVFTCDVSFVCHGRPAVPFAEVERRLRRMEERFSRFRPDSELSRLNSADGRWRTVSAELYRLLRLSLNVAVASKGLVNVAVLPALRAAGYTRSWPPRTADAWRPDRAAGWVPVPPLTSVLELSGRRARLRPGHAVDFGALAKGVWADDVVSWLGPDAAASLGGDVSCRGPGPTGSGWPVGLPDGERLVVRDGAVATSGTARRRWGDGLHHIVDPRTGGPSASDVSRATVVASTGACAEWVSTALVVGGSRMVPTFAARHDVCGWRLTTTEESHG